MKFQLGTEVEFRKIVGLRQIDFAGLFRVPRETITMMESGQRQNPALYKRILIIRNALENSMTDPEQSASLKLSPDEKYQVNRLKRRKEMQLANYRQKLADLEMNAYYIRELQYRLPLIKANVQELAKKAEVKEDDLNFWIDMAIQMQKSQKYKCTSQQQAELKMKIAALEAEILEAEKILAENG